MRPRRWLAPVRGGRVDRPDSFVFFSGTSLSSGVSFPALALVVAVCAGTFAVCWRSGGCGWRACGPASLCFTWAVLWRWAARPEGSGAGDNPSAGPSGVPATGAAVGLMGLLLFRWRGAEISPPTLRRLHVRNLVGPCCWRCRRTPSSRDCLACLEPAGIGVRGSSAPAPSLSRPPP